MVLEQKFKDLVNSKYLVSPERIVLYLESEVMRGLGPIPTRGNILLLNFLFSCCKASDASIGIIASVVCLWKPELTDVNRIMDLSHTSHQERNIWNIFLFTGHGLDKPLFPLIVIIGLIGNTLSFLVSLWHKGYIVEYF